MPTAARTAVIYARISEKEDSVDKVANQVHSLHELASREGYTVMDTFTDDDVTAYKGKKRRNGFIAMLARVKAGGVDVVLATEPQRLTRGSLSELEAMHLVLAQARAVLHTLAAGVQDPSTPTTKALMQIMDVMGGLEVETKTYRQVLRNEAETSAGMPLWGKRPFGFRLGDSKRWTEHEPREAEAIRWAVDFFLKPVQRDKPEGKIYGVMQEWTARGLREGGWTYASVRTVLRNPRNAGLLVRHGVVQDVKAAWEPIISREDWQAVQDKLSDPKRRDNPGRKPHSLGSGLVQCACGLPMRATTIKGIPRGAEGPSRVVQGLPGLRCDVTRAKVPGKGPHVSVRDDELNPVLVDAVASAFLVGPANMLSSDDGVDLRAIEAELAQVRADRARLVSLVAKDLVSEGDIDTHLRPLKVREADLEDQRVAAVSKSAASAMLVDLKTSMWIGNRLASWDADVKVKEAYRERFESLPLAQQRELVRRLLDVVVLPGKGVKADPGRRVVVRHKVVQALNDEDTDLYEGP